ncbi:hypothetical protein NC652_021535 [Populus alba x Populus x berolinensis]|nr:hypothetical protein NC652_021535 [Populus alba x Populus x berolinensis]
MVLCLELGFAGKHAFLLPHILLLHCHGAWLLWSRIISWCGFSMGIPLLSGWIVSEMELLCVYRKAGKVVILTPLHDFMVHLTDHLVRSRFKLIRSSEGIERESCLVGITHCSFLWP